MLINSAIGEERSKRLVHLLAEDFDAFLFQHVRLQCLLKLLFTDFEVLGQLGELLAVWLAALGIEVFVVGLLLHQRVSV